MDDRIGLAILVLLMILALGVYAKVRILPILRIGGVFIKLVWKARANLRKGFDPRTPQGRWSLLGSVLVVVAAFFALALVAVIRSDSSQNNKIIIFVLSLALIWITAHLASLCFWRAKRFGARPGVKPSPSRYKSSRHLPPFIQGRFQGLRTHGNDKPQAEY